MTHQCRVRCFHSRAPKEGLTSDRSSPARGHPGRVDPRSRAKSEVPREGASAEWRSFRLYRDEGCIPSGNDSKVDQMEAITLTPPTRSSALLKGLPDKWRRSSSGPEGHSRRVDSNEGLRSGLPARDIIRCAINPGIRQPPR